MSEVVAEFIYKTSNPIVKDLARSNGHIAYTNRYNSKAPLPAWKDKFESLMEKYDGTRFSFGQLENWVNNKQIQDRYYDITVALYNSLRPHYITTSK